VSKVGAASSVWGFKVGAASRGGFSGRLLGAASSVSTGVGCQYFVFMYLCCSACVGTRTAFHTLGFSHNWLCQRCTNANKRLLATHLEFSFLSRAPPPGLALSLRHTLHVPPPSDAGGCPRLMSLIDTTEKRYGDTRRYMNKSSPECHSH